MKIYSKDTFAEAYRELLAELMGPEGKKSDPRSNSTKEMIDVCIEIKNPLNCLYFNEIRSSQKKYIAAEFIWYFLGRNDAEFISKYAKFWKTIQNSDGTVNSAYGNLIFREENEHCYNEYTWALKSLQNDRNSRQSVMHFNKPSHQWNGNKDFVCTMYASFLIRNNKLRMSVKMRSNDVILGMPTDIAFFTVLQQQMLSHLRQTTYPDLELGTYSHVVDSMHIYEKDFEKALDMLHYSFENRAMPILSEDLIDYTGSPLNILKKLELMSDFKRGDCFDLLQTHPDDLIVWIYENITSNKKKLAYEK
jgi:thymidylate synthase